MPGRRGGTGVKAQGKSPDALTYGRWPRGKALEWAEAGWVRGPAPERRC